MEPKGQALSYDLPVVQGRQVWDHVKSSSDQGYKRADIGASSTGPQQAVDGFFWANHTLKHAHARPDFAMLSQQSSYSCKRSCNIELLLVHM